MWSIRQNIKALIIALIVSNLLLTISFYSQPTEEDTFNSSVPITAISRANTNSLPIFYTDFTKGKVDFNRLIHTKNECILLIDHEYHLFINNVNGCKIHSFILIHQLINLPPPITTQIA